MSASLDYSAWQLTWFVRGKLPTCKPIQAITHDFHGGRRDVANPVPGPFGIAAVEARQEKLSPIPRTAEPLP